MTTCKNCGHESHCGVTLTKEFIKQRDKGPEGSIEVCKNCRCEKCSRPDWGQENQMLEGFNRLNGQYGFNTINCNRCQHECHCDNLVCFEAIGVGMTDKNMPCGCSVCECTSQKPYPI